MLEEEKFQPIKFFIEPVIVTLNQIDVDYSFDMYNMIGKNEGGWTTVVVSALDDRIKQIETKKNENLDIDNSGLFDLSDACGRTGD